jgi:hypothetical protein
MVTRMSATSCQRALFWLMVIVGTPGCYSYSNGTGGSADSRECGGGPTDQTCNGAQTDGSTRTFALALRDTNMCVTKALSERARSQSEAQSCAQNCASQRGSQETVVTGEATAHWFAYYCHDAALSGTSASARCQTDSLLAMSVPEARTCAKSKCTSEFPGTQCSSCCVVDFTNDVDPSHIGAVDTSVINGYCASHTIGTTDPTACANP